VNGQIVEHLTLKGDVIYTFSVDPQSIWRNANGWTCFSNAKWAILTPKHGQNIP
jgi:hypothetical protein